jgi:hypothetical protein
MLQLGRLWPCLHRAINTTAYYDVELITSVTGFITEALRLLQFHVSIQKMLKSLQIDLHQKVFWLCLLYFIIPNEMAGLDQISKDVT